eukprot:3491714-Pyramimonas_sp.AAC.1
MDLAAGADLSAQSELAATELLGRVSDAVVRAGHGHSQNLDGHGRAGRRFFGCQRPSLCARLGGDQ